MLGLLFPRAGLFPIASFSASWQVRKFLACKTEFYVKLPSGMAGSKDSSHVPNLYHCDSLSLTLTLLPLLLFVPWLGSLLPWVGALPRALCLENGPEVALLRGRSTLGGPFTEEDAGMREGDDRSRREYTPHSKSLFSTFLV